MPQNNPITIKDGAATPTDHVYNPVEIKGGAARFENAASSTSLAGREVMTIGLKRPQPGGRTTFENSVVLEMPKMVTGTGASGEVVQVRQYTNKLIITEVIDPRSSQQERKDLRVLGSNALANATIAQAFDNAESFW